MKPLPLRVLRRFKHIGLLLLLLFTAYMTAGRLLMPLVSTRSESVEARLTQMIGAPVTLADIKGSWFRFSPSIVITDLRIGNTPQQHSIERVELSLDMKASLLARRAVVDRIRVANINFTLQEQSDGRWGLAGVPSRGGNYLDPVLDFLLQTNELSVNEGVVVLQRQSGQPIVIGSVIVGIQNRGTDHDAQVQLRINDQASPAHLVIQLDGDPRSIFLATAWLDTGQMDWLTLLQPQLPVSWQWRQLQGGGRFWVSLDSNGLQNFAAELSDLDIDAARVDSPQVLALQNGSVQLAARPVYRDATQPADWNVRAQNLAFDWQNTPWEVEKLQLALTQVTEAPPSAAEPAAATLNKTLLLQADALDVAMLNQVLTTAVPMPAQALSALQTLQPQGRLTNVQLESSTTGTYPQGFRLRSNLDNVAVAAWQQAPSASGLVGYVEATAQGGFAEVDSRDLTLQLPLLFGAPWHFDKVNTRVDWQASRDDVKVHSSIIDVANADLAGRVSFAIHNTRNAEGLWFNELSLQIGMDRLQVSAAPTLLPTIPRLQGTMDWLRTALLGGELGESAFLMHSLSGRAAPENATTVASWYRVKNGALQFLPDWPRLTDLEATVVQRNNSLDIAATRGTLAGIAVDSAMARIRSTENDRQLLSLSATATTDTAVGLDFLRNTPVHATLGSFLDNWQAAGTLALNVGVGVDLRQPDQKPYVNVVTTTTDSRLDLTDFDLQLGDIAGEIRYSSDSGLEADGLAARLFDYPLQATITTEAAGTPAQTVKIAGDGRASVVALQQWSGQPVFVRELFNYMQGEVDYHGQLTVAPAASGVGSRTNLLIESDLIGLTSSLPAPLIKAADESAPFAVELGFENDIDTMDLRYSDFLTGSLLLDAAGIQRGQVSIGDRNRNFTVRQSDANAAGVLVSGDMDRFDVPAWEDIARELNKAGGEGRAVADYLRLVDVNVGELVLPGLTLENANVVVRHAEAAWQIDARNDFLAGKLAMPDDAAKPWQIALDYLRFPPRPVLDTTVAVPPEEVDPLADTDPTELPAFDFKTAELSFGDQSLGAISLQYRPHARGASITNFNLQSPDSTITDTTRTTGAAVDWEYLNGVHRTRFTGLFAAGDLAKVLPAWGHDANVISREARFDSDLNWPGSPLFFSLERASGTINMDIDDGRFVDIESGSTRLLGALNFDALVRRLQLDFSDIFSKGYSFDSIDGFLTLTDGIVTTTTPLTIDGPSSDLSIEGEINLRDETIAADMQVQIPLGANVSMVAGLLGAWPIAVSAYLASKIFQNQVEDFTTVVYRLEGPWAQPTAGFEPPEDAVAVPATPVQ
ncbi:MAG: YhdP family protein [Pseudomonadota bacterium]